MDISDGLGKYLSLIFIQLLEGLGKLCPEGILPFVPLSSSMQIHKSEQGVAMPCAQIQNSTLWSGFW